MRNAQQQVGVESLDIVPVVVDDVPAAIECYTDVLGFEVRTDETFEMEGHEGRWVTIGLPGDGVDLSIMAADDPYYDDETRSLVESKRGTQTWYTFATADWESSTAALDTAGVEVTRQPVEYPWGTEAVFADPSGNEFSLFEYAG
jgi:predicted enzyme related to lactoylglutathione lyase